MIGLIGGVFRGVSAVNHFKSVVLVTSSQNNTRRLKINVLLVGPVRTVLAHIKEMMGNPDSDDRENDRFVY